ncbi:MAG: hypothetical protein KZQ64_05305 [gamma proteobacterium symbiont of Bathyaustriella thionipta]|nr:hypothetical protein [gamma proteobacterium symbiont of Bathyaustriella thionipta]MCU7949099.1 hypothetical protein [gamma proteobacterium symbiont of Bathyaustriella thionipta]MCU7952795.1 hypothetical protein [gamma proteobacterium symbiont of Bathyaustriella thionipta]MCU7955686.1 hypothetical protein [gamma proteobacterium symbiont of Bathyaustriella thionipta]MCU7968000.1 hypothetical protein [gamma proteobacterium symbiont of Bathyaustriella thionipta]
MSNSITVSITFSFKGETFHPTTIIDLDALMKNSLVADQDTVLASIYPFLAASINIDTYSYAYEIMQAGDAVYSDPTGIAANHLQDGKFDYQSFRQEWFYNKTLNTVQAIADKYFPEIDLKQQPQLKEALIEAFETGKNSQ